MLKRLFLAGFALALMGVNAPVEYSIEANRYGVSPDIPVGALVASTASCPCPDTMRRSFRNSPPKDAWRRSSNRRNLR